MTNPFSRENEKYWATKYKGLTNEPAWLTKKILRIVSHFKENNWIQILIGKIKNVPKKIESKLNKSQSQNNAVIPYNE